MPKDYRVASNNYRAAPVVLPSDAQSGTRVTTIWSTEDDDVLMSARASGLNWQPIASKHFPSKTANACRKRHERLMERRNTEDWDGPKLETLAVNYMAVRREMWSLLADRVGEKWQVIESKCMEKGQKNLQAAFKSAQRKERGMMNEEHDSGIGCYSDAECEIDGTSMMIAESSRQAAMQTGGHHDPMMGMGMGMGRGSGGHANMSIQSMLSPSPPAC